MARTVLIVDDDADFRALARALLERSGYAVVGEARDAHSARAAVGDLSPDAVLLDVCLPDGDGFALAASLGRGERAPRIVLTSCDDAPALGSLARDAGALRFVAKDALPAVALDSLWEPPTEEG